MKSTWLAPRAENARSHAHNHISASRASTPATALMRLLVLALVVLTGTAPGLASAADAPPPAPPPTYESVVAAPRRDPSIPREDLTASASVVTSERTPRSAETLPQLISELPGVTVTRYGSHGSLSTLSVRGSSPNQVAVYADGVPLTSAVTGALDLGLLPLTASQRIELYRGASPLAFGSSAMGGLVSLTSETPSRSAVSLHSGMGSFGTRMGGGELALVGVGGEATVVGRCDLFTSRADFPYRSDNRTLFDPSDDRTLRRSNNQLEQADASVRATAPLPGRRQLRFALAGFSRSQGLPARGTESSVSAALHRRRAYLSGTYQSWDDLGQQGELRATAYTLVAEQRFEDPLQEISFVPSRTRDRSLTAGVTVLGDKSLRPALSLQALLDARHEGFFPQDSLQPARRRQGRREFAAAGLGSTVFLPGGWLTVVSSLRAELARDVVGSSQSLFEEQDEVGKPTSYFLPIARAGLVASVHPALRLRANAGRYARLPTLFERYGNGGFIQGNHRLAPESGLNADAGAALELSGPDAALALDAGVFLARSRDLIHFQERGPFASFENVSRSRTLGAELSLHGRLGPWAHLLLQSTLLRSRDASGISGQHGHFLPLMPLWRGYARPELRQVPVGAGLQVGVYADAEATGHRYQDPANLVRQPSRIVVGIGGFLEHRATGLRLTGSGYNLGDEQAPDALYFPLPGRSFFLTLHFNYQLAKDPT